MPKKLDIIESYLRILADDDNITFFHHHHDEKKDQLKVVTVYDEGKKYRIKFTINGDVIFNLRYANLEPINRLISELLPENYG